MDLSDLRQAWCLRHHRHCSLRTACTHVAGTSCTDFSAIGKGEGEKGATYIHFLIWVAHRKSLQEPVVVQENVTNFPRDTLQRLLPEYEWTFGVVSPDCLGWPIRRDRQWCVHGAKSFSIPLSLSCSTDTAPVRRRPHYFCLCPCLLLQLHIAYHVACCSCWHLLNNVEFLCAGCILHVACCSCWHLLNNVTFLCAGCILYVACCSCLAFSEQCHISMCW